MFCSNCGNQVPDNSTFCAVCGATLGGASPLGQGMQNNPYGTPQNQVYGGVPQTIPNYLVWTILETFFCCIPLGIIGIIYSCKANSAKSVGNYAEAIKSAEVAKSCLIWGVVFCFIVIGFNIIIMIGNL